MCHLGAEQALRSFPEPLATLRASAGRRAASLAGRTEMYGKDNSPKSPAGVKGSRNYELADFLCDEIMGTRDV